MEPLNFTCRTRDIRHIRIRCRCGTISVAEIPQQVARAHNLHPCPGCHAGYVITQPPDGRWHIERVVDDIADITTVPLQEPQREERVSYLGMRIQITDGSKTQINGMRCSNPHPEHLGKFGTIVGEEDCGGGYTTPIIKLDDGTKLTGAECWWTPVAN